MHGVNSGVNMVGQQLKSVDWGELDSLNLRNHTMQWVPKLFPRRSKSQIVKITCEVHALLSRPSGRLRGLVEHWSRLDMYDCSFWDRWVRNHAEGAGPVFVDTIVLLHVALEHAKNT